LNKAEEQKFIESIKIGAQRRLREGWQRIPHSRSCGVLVWLTARSNREGRITQYTEYIAFGEVFLVERNTKIYEYNSP
jgi:hypothetical protein